jgi:hypothetical protein
MNQKHALPVLQAADILREEGNAIRGAGSVSPELQGVGLYQRLNERGLAALCLSGGGIRSASFSLGVVQATVSGGGYLGAFLSAWLTRAHLALQL